VALEGLTTRLGLFMAVCGWLGCAAASGCRKSESKSTVVVLHNAQGDEVRIQVEVVSRPEEKARGLMFRDRLGADQGMLFVYPSEDQHPFWMKNTHIPLDMIFIGANRRIVGVVQNAEPMTTERRAVDLPSQFVLEVNGGFFEAHGMRTGTPVRIEGLPDLD
jgi:uncharacterized membrane protein (UPF0127 family)